MRTVFDALPVAGLGADQQTAAVPAPGEYVLVCVTEAPSASTLVGKLLARCSNADGAEREREASAHRSGGSGTPSTRTKR
jgi:hypothetical protein